MESDIQQWVDTAKYDLETAKAMLKARRYLYVVFASQQSIEKMLKALAVKTTKNFPPRTHDLLKLAQLALVEIDEELKEFLAKLSFYYIETRYPSELADISKSITRKIASEYLNKTNEVFKWLKRKL